VSRETRTAIAADTDRIVARGHYTAPSGAQVDIARAVRDAVTGTRHHLPEDLEAVVPPVDGDPAIIEVTGESTLQAARRLALAAPDTVVCLNFASAHEPGGGYRRGAQAQEESLARSSALVATLESVPEYYALHHEQNHPFATDRIIHSPGVPVFRDDDANLLENPYRVSFLTAAAPNAERARSLPQEERDRIADVLRVRAGKVLAAAVRHNHRRLVLGAWGCGVFGNDAETVAGVFRDHLRGPYANRFSQVVFAVLDYSPRQEQRNTFERVLRTV
jgi:uncharacterized protein (TIGR02452 family)